ncbi:hypothetical protein C1646_777695 [Rhizophagus diaphanus]|nr:hypothetical protein C1646_777695 [Rhizophagus diaphanus] [Rhizophagus sp. MUCL 43196]
MNKIFAVYLFLLGLIIYVHAADVMVNIGGAKGENVFEPESIVAMPGDNIVFTWVSGKHSVIETDSLTVCAKSVIPNAFSSGGAFMAPKTWTLPIPANDTRVITWFYCGVPGHCIPGTGGMVGTLQIPVALAAAPVSTSASAAAIPSASSKAASSKATTAAAASAKASSGYSPSDNYTSNTPNMVGAIIGSLIGGSLLTIGSFFLYKKFKNYNKNKNVILVPGDSNNNFNPGGQVHNNTEDYITQIVRQELMQNQRK